jgi:hypothetical protein
MCLQYNNKMIIKICIKNHIRILKNKTTIKIDIKNETEKIINQYQYLN